MKQIVFLILNSAFLILNCNAQSPDFSVYLIGDAGNDTITNENMKLLSHHARQQPNSAILFLGDNIYPQGLETLSKSEKKSRLSEKRLLSQLEPLKTYKGQVYFVPGNHDWKQGKWQGLKYIKEEARYVEQYFKNTEVSNRNEHTFIPQNGLPGPYSVMLTEKIRLIAIDTQWWLQSQFFHKTPKPDGLNRKQTTAKFYRELDSLLNAAKTNNEKVVIAAHHPMFTNGHHSRSLVNYMPLQFFGLIGLNRMLVQDIPQPRYHKMRKKLLATFNKYEHLIIVAGHEHTLQYFEDGNNTHIVSGAGSKRTHINKNRYKANFMNDIENGFFRLDFYSNGSVIANIFGATTGGIIHEQSVK
jgi:predicted phosphodiesterase